MAASPKLVPSTKEDKDSERKAKRKTRRRIWFDMARALLIGQKKS